MRRVTILFCSCPRKKGCRQPKASVQHWSSCPAHPASTCCQAAAAPGSLSPVSAFLQAQEAQPGLSRCGGVQWGSLAELSRQVLSLTSLLRAPQLLLVLLFGQQQDGYTAQGLVAPFLLFGGLLTHADHAHVECAPSCSPVQTTARPLRHGVKPMDAAQAQGRYGAWACPCAWRSLEHRLWRMGCRAWCSELRVAC